MPIGKLILSKSRRQKLILLFREKQRSYLNGKTVQRTGSACPSDDQFWEYTVKASIPKSLFTQDSTTSKQDHQDAAGIATTKHRYKISTIKNGYLLTNNVNHRTVFDSNGQSIPDLSFGKLSRNGSHDLRHPVLKKVPGVTASICGTVGMNNGNYGHWLIDGLARLLLIKQVMGLEGIDNIATPAFVYDFQKESIKAFGFSDGQIVEISALECVQFEELICTTPPRGNSSTLCPGWLIDGYRELFLQKDSASTTPKSTAKKRLYISRKDANSRKLVNEDAVIALLTQYGFESVQLSQFAFEEKIALFKNAECVIGLSGAGLSNIMFCNRGTKFIELCPPRSIHYLFASIGSHLDFEYDYIVLQNASVLSYFNKFFGHLKLNTSELESKLKSLNL